MKEWIIETSGLSKRYKGRYAVSNLNLKIGKGEIFGFLGPNGAGKTTTIRMLLGLIQPSGGSIQIFGQPLRRNRLQILRRIGSLVEYPSYYGHLSATDNLEAIRRIIDAPMNRISEVLEIVGLTKEAKRPVKGFSLGMKQRLGIASALLGSPELLVLDEPTNGLDPAGILEIRELIKAMPREHGITVLISSHLLSEVEQMANTVGIIRQGEMVFQDSMAGLREQAQGSMALRVSDSMGAMRVLADRGIQSEHDGSLLTIGRTDDEFVAKAVRELVASGHSVYRVEERRKSLEELFLRIVGEGRGL
ncbi:ABC transporter ATP-binding protein [Paenibacillus sp. 1011MAR3C5]|uniref:ABC transporter ATP-binding protein n=1 Tax=Paenibacillus sp. 1011MAR3C5 TaxID=1675787 RepID=UPI000E6CCFE6|nr:ABC transporter ATP-binding protein [Paenibacillus sp. 1011MAR3C5]RJE84408.1 ABC transporter ATP-binding protein [Paenibacillus sp. 1011MAR3C5]